MFNNVNCETMMKVMRKKYHEMADEKCGDLFSILNPPSVACTRIL